MAAKKRIDLGTRIAGDKAKLADEFITKSQLVTPDGNALETLANGDLVVPAATSDHLVMADVGDATPGTLIDKIFSSDNSVYIATDNSDPDNIMLDLTVDAAGGGLPSGTENQTLRHNGADWVANSNIRHVKSWDIDNETAGSQTGIAVKVEDGGFGFHELPVIDLRYLFTFPLSGLSSFIAKLGMAELEHIPGDMGLILVTDQPNAQSRAEFSTEGIFISNLIKLKYDTGNGGHLELPAYENKGIAYLNNDKQLMFLADGNEGEILMIDSEGNYHWSNTQEGASGTFTSQDGKTVTVTNGIITSIV